VYCPIDSKWKTPIKTSSCLDEISDKNDDRVFRSIKCTSDQIIQSKILYHTNISKRFWRSDRMKKQNHSFCFCNLARSPNTMLVRARAQELSHLCGWHVPKCWRQIHPLQKIIYNSRTHRHPVVHAPVCNFAI